MNSKRPSTWWDYMPTDGGEEVKNHKWVTESELSTGIEEFVIGAVPGLLVPGTAFLFGKALWGT